jgi:hypothetical protein
MRRRYNTSLPPGCRAGPHKKLIQINSLWPIVQRLLQPGAPLAGILQHTRIDALQLNSEGLLDAC